MIKRILQLAFVGLAIGYFAYASDTLFQKKELPRIQETFANEVKLVRKSNETYLIYNGQEIPVYKRNNILCGSPEYYFSQLTREEAEFMCHEFNPLTRLKSSITDLLQ